MKSYSFDAWGRRRNPTNWTYTDVPSTFLFSRGFTGHEHLNVFGLINMNGRVYDPILGRFLGPDKFVQSPSSTQSFNRYSYCINNPLRYFDANGYKWGIFKAFNWIAQLAVEIVVNIAAVAIGIPLAIITTAGTIILGVGDGIFKADWSTLKNGAKIVGGLFTGSPKQILSRFTNELPQTIVGYVVSQGSNMIGDVENVSYYDGATVVQHYSDSEGWGAFTIGSFINGDRNIKADPSNHLFQHEYGHYLQSQAVNWEYLTKKGIPSLMDVASGSSYYQHAYFHVEQNANIKAREHFGEGVWDYENNPIYGSGKNDFYDAIYGKYRTPNLTLWESTLLSVLIFGK